MRRAALWCLVGLALVFGLSGAGCAQRRIVGAAGLDAGRVSEVVRETARTRNLPLREALPVELVSKDFVRGQFAQSVTAYVSPGRIAAYQALLKALKLVPPDFDASAYAADMLGRRVVGYYDSTSGTMRIVRRQDPFGPAVAFAETLAGRDLAGEFLLAHELSHALADQHFDLLAFFSAVTGNADALLARQAFVEGDAQVTGLAYVLGNRMRRIAFLPGEEAFLRNPLDDWFAIPPVFRRPGLFLYLNGWEFASLVYGRGGTRGLDAVYGRPPRSSEEVLHPEKYFAGDDPPVSVTFEADPAELGAYELLDENTLGELGIQALLVQSLGYCGAKVAAGGWGGDRFRLYRSRDEAASVGFAWRTVWDAPHEREEFAANLGAALERTYGSVGAERGGVTRWHTPAGEFALRYEGQTGAMVTLSGAAP